MAVLDTSVKDVPMRPAAVASPLETPAGSFGVGDQEFFVVRLVAHAGHVSDVIGIVPGSV